MLAHPHRDFLRGAIFGTNMETVERLLRSCRDLTTGLALALDANGELRMSLFILQRALGEAVMRLCYIMEHQRRARGGALTRGTDRQGRLHSRRRRERVRQRRTPRVVRGRHG